MCDAAYFTGDGLPFSRAMFITTACLLGRSLCCPGARGMMICEVLVLPFVLDCWTVPLVAAMKPRLCRPSVKLGQATRSQHRESER